MKKTSLGRPDLFNGVIGTHKLAAGAVMLKGRKQWEKSNNHFNQGMSTIGKMVRRGSKDGGGSPETTNSVVNDRGSP